MRKGNRSRLDREEPMLNLTPLIDVVFVVLITFIIIAPLLERETISLAEVSGASLSSSSVVERSPIAIYVDAEDRIRLCDDRYLTLCELESALRESHATYPMAIPQLFQDQNARFGTYQSVKNSAERAGFSAIELVLTPASSHRNG